MAYSYSNLGAGNHSQSQSNLVPGNGSGNNAGAFSDPADAENQYDDYYQQGHPQPPSYPTYGSNSNSNSPLQPPYLHPGYAHNQAYSDDYGSSSNLAGTNNNVSSPPYGTSSTSPSPAHSYGNIPPDTNNNSNTGRDTLHPIGPRIMSPSNADNPNVPPHHAVHWISADQHNRLGVPNDGNGNGNMYPSYSGDTFTSNINPFDAPMDQPLAPNNAGGGGNSNPNEDIPLLEQHGRYGSGYSQAMMGMPGAMPPRIQNMGPGGFMDPNMMLNEDDDEMSQVRYGRIPQRVPRRLKTIKQGGSDTFFFCFCICISKHPTDISSFFPSWYYSLAVQRQFGIRRTSP